MTVKNSHADWAFNAELFAEHLQKMNNSEMQATADLMGLSYAALKRWRKGIYATDYNFPPMSNFISLCNLLDLDPRDYFTL